MGRLRFLKYLATLLASTALTFHLLHWKVDNKSEGGGVVYDREGVAKTDTDTPLAPTNYVFTKSHSFLLRKLSERNSTPQNAIADPPRWVVLAGNVTVHEGNEIVPFDVPFRTRAESVCRGFEASRPLKLMIFVASSLDHFEQRRAIRETWGLKMLQEAYHYRIVFLLGSGTGEEEVERSVAKEGYRYGDLVQISLQESFRNLGKKSVAGLRWSKDFCPHSEFVMKTDDDILVHVPNLLSALKGREGQPLLLCHQNRMRKILRRGWLDEKDVPKGYHKYEVAEEEIPGQYYPPYCSGMAYVMSRSVRDRLLTACLSTPPFFIEDVHVTGFCRHKAGVLIAPHPGITLRPALSLDLSAACQFRDGRVTSQELGPRELRLLWAELNTQGFFCPELVGLARDASQRTRTSTLGT